LITACLPTVSNLNLHLDASYIHYKKLSGCRELHIMNSSVNVYESLWSRDR